jgi:hypothetical protein
MREEGKVTLQETLQKFKAGVLTRVSAADLEIMEKATAELVRSGLAARAKKIGDQAPDFTLPNSSGEAVRLADLLARGPVVLTFYRGTW